MSLWSTIPQPSERSRRLWDAMLAVAANIDNDGTCETFAATCGRCAVALVEEHERLMAPPEPPDFAEDGKGGAS